MPALLTVDVPDGVNVGLVEVSRSSLLCAEGDRRGESVVSGLRKLERSRLSVRGTFRMGGSGDEGANVGLSAKWLRKVGLAIDLGLFNGLAFSGDRDLARSRCYQGSSAPRFQTPVSSRLACIYVPARRASLSLLPFSISSSNFLVRSASSLSRLSPSSLILRRNSFTSSEPSFAGSIASDVLIRVLVLR